MWVKDEKLVKTRTEFHPHTPVLIAARYSQTSAQ